MARGRYLVNPLRMVASALSGALGWMWGQLTGACRNFWALLGSLTLDELLPPSIVSTIQFYISAIPAALGLRNASRERMVSAIITLGIIVTLSTVITLGLTIGALIVLGILFLIALLRLFPAFNSKWKRSTGGLIKSDYDLPGWKRD